VRRRTTIKSPQGAKEDAAIVQLPRRVSRTPRVQVDLDFNEPNLDAEITHDNRAEDGP
jgi:hypothetical protein